MQKFASLKSYFVSEDWDDQRFEKLRGWFQNPLAKPALLHQSNAISIFINFNSLLQIDEPSIHSLKPAMENLGRKLGSRILQADVLCRHNNSIYEIHLGNNNLFNNLI